MYFLVPPPLVSQEKTQGTQNKCFRFCLKFNSKNLIEAKEAKEISGRSGYQQKKE